MPTSFRHFRHRCPVCRDSHGSSGSRREYVIIILWCKQCQSVDTVHIHIQSPDCHRLQRLLLCAAAAEILTSVFASLPRIRLVVNHVLRRFASTRPQKDANASGSVSCARQFQNTPGLARTPNSYSWCANDNSRISRLWTSKDALPARCADMYTAVRPVAAGLDCKWFLFVDCLETNRLFLRFGTVHNSSRAQ